MKIDRHLAILNLLTQYSTLTAPYLAEKLEVSRRTINRDIEELCKAGIPIVTRQGNNGGIGLIEGYIIDKTLLKKDELTNILVALNGLNSVGASEKVDLLIARLVTEELSDIDDMNMIIDLASHYKSSLSTKIRLFKAAIKEQKISSFKYYGPKGKSIRRVEPYKVIYHWADWYLLGYCLNRDDFRLFKLNRLWDLVIEEGKYYKRNISKEILDFDKHLADNQTFEVLFDKDVEYLVVEAYGPKSYEEREGKLYFKGTYTNLDYITAWLLGFGNKAEVIGPDNLIQHLKHCVMKFLDRNDTLT